MKNRIEMKIKNFGPLSVGSFELPLDKIEFSKYTLFIGDQGTGKSTVVKLFSIFSWLEKSFVRKIYDSKNFLLSDFRNLLENQNIPKSYLTSETYIEYAGNAFCFYVDNKTINIKEFVSDFYICPKILYVPSERNILSVINRTSDIKDLPEMVNQLSLEMRDANRKILKKSKSFFGEYVLSYNSKLDLNKISIKGSSSIPLKNASSGLQSIVPLLLVSEYMNQEVSRTLLEKIKSLNSRIKELCIESFSQDEPLSEELKNFIKSGIDKNFSDDDINVLSDKLKKYVNSAFVEIVEEPEQNLYPTSQILLVQKLIENMPREADKLIMTTHSPYILSMMNNLIYAKEQYDKYNKQISDIPKNLFIDFNDVRAYKIKDGRVFNILNSEAMMIDVSEIDECSNAINDTFERLFDLGE